MDNKIKHPSKEIFFHSLPLPTYSFSGLSFGNIASMTHAREVSHPKKAALQVLYQMKTLLDLQQIVGLIPPLERPAFSFLRELGFQGKEKEILKEISKHAPDLMLLVSSSSNFWAANIASISPSSDTEDGKVHITPSNLATTPHRALESVGNEALLKRIFSDERYFIHHPKVPLGVHLGDEGSANDLRFSSNSLGLNLFVYGKENLHGDHPLYPQRQSRYAKETLIRRHLLDKNRCLLAKQNPEAINQGIFHNDLLSCGTHQLFLYQNEAFVNTPQVIHELQNKSRELFGEELKALPISISFEKALSTYFFNSILIYDNGSYHVVAEKSSRALESFFPADSIHYVDLSESLKNGGGPSCLTLRMHLTQEERKSLNQNLFLNLELYRLLVHWVEKHFRDELKLGDLSDPKLLDETKAALDNLSQILHFDHK